MILDPINDGECLGQLTVFARELAPSTLVRSVAAHLGTRDAVIAWLQSLPQSDDFGDEKVRVIQCDVPQRARLFPDDPNCVERSMAALMLLEVIEPLTLRALATVDKPLRHTGLVEKRGTRWLAVDLFPRRNASRNFRWDGFGKDTLQGAHNYVGKPILKFYLGDSGGKVADALGDQEDSWIGRSRKKQPEKKPEPPTNVAQRPSEQPKPKQQPAAGAQPQPARFDFTRHVGAGANQNQAAPAGAGGKDAKKEEGAAGGALDAPGGFSFAVGGTSEAAAEGSHRDSYDAGATAQRLWRSLGRR